MSVGNVLRKIVGRFFLGKEKMEEKIEKAVGKTGYPPPVPVTIKRLSPPLTITGKIEEQYNAGFGNLAKVQIYYDPETSTYTYIVEEPPLSDLEKNVYGMVVDKLHASNVWQQLSRVNPAEREKYFDAILHDVFASLGLERMYYESPALRYYLVRDQEGWRELDVLMKDKWVEEIDVSMDRETGNHVVRVIHKKYGKEWLDTNLIYKSSEELTELIRFMASRCGQQITVTNPVVEAITPEGHRIAASLREVGDAPYFTIRKFPEVVFSVTELINYGTLSPLIAAYLWTLIEARRFIMIIGGMATGKTTLLQALTSMIPSSAKIVTIEDVRELKIPHKHVQAYRTRYSIFSEAKSIDLYDLVRYSFRTRGDYIIVGEVRDKEIYPLVQVVSSGHGSLCLDYSDRIIVKENDSIEVKKIGELVEEVLTGKTINNINVLSFDLKEMKPVWKPLRRVIKAPTEKWIIVKTADGRELKYTPDHLIPILKQGKIETKTARKLEKGDKLLVVKSPKHHSTTKISRGNLSYDTVKYVEKATLPQQEWAYDIEVEGTHTFIHNASVVTHNCTMHADDPQSLFLRVTSPPMNVKEAFLLQFHCIVFLRAIQAGRKVKRRVSNIWEITGIKRYTGKAEVPVSFVEVFRWNPVDDAHVPQSVEDVVSISHQLKVIGRMKYGDELWRECILEELYEKKKFIEELIEEKIFDYREVAERIRRKSIELRMRRWW